MAPLTHRLSPAPIRSARSSDGDTVSIASLCFALFLYAALVGLTPFQSTDPGETSYQANLGYQVMHVAIFLLVLFGSGLRSMRALLCVPAGLTVLLGYCYCSTLWAIDPAISFRRITLTTMTVWTTFRLVGDLGPDRTLRLLRQLLLVLLIANFLAVLLMPDGIHRNILIEEESIIGSWRGIISHKNIAGAIAAVTIILFLFDNKQFPRPVTVAVVVAAAVFLYFSNSKTSQGIVVLAILSGIVIRPYSADYRVVLGGILLVVAVVVLMLLSANSSVLADILNDPNALTGRAQIWPLLIDYGAAHPWGGAGFMSFWAIGDASPIWTLTSSWVAGNIQHGHNGYLDLLVTIGVPGLLLTVATMLVWPLMRLLFSLSIAKPRRSLLLSLIVFCAGQNMTESTLLNTASYTEVFLLIAIAIIYRQSQGSAGQHHDLRRRALRFLGLRRARPVR